ncbi:hypothetical protein D3C76_416990 [compost metagenome]|jgi:hypothetical protein
MDEGMREKIALFRYGLIAPLLNGQVDRAVYLAEVRQRNMMYLVTVRNGMRPRRFWNGCYSTAAKVWMA